MASSPAYIIAARRSALGRVGGLHKGRRIEELCAPIVAAALRDAGINANRVDEVIVGNATQGGNPARLIALAAGLSDSVPAATVDRQCGSGLDAILAANRAIAAGDAEVMVAGGAEALSTAPWRIAKPRTLYQLPRFTSFEPGPAEEGGVPPLVEATEALAARLGISRAQQDAFALRTHLKAEAARTSKRLTGEIVPIRANAEEARDQSAVEPDFKDLAQLAPYQQPDGTLTPGNTSAMHDGAAMTVIVSERIWAELGKPRALRLVAQAIRGVGPEEEASAPIEAMKTLNQRLNGFKRSDIGIIELSEFLRGAGHCVGAEPRARRGPAQSGRRRDRTRASARRRRCRARHASLHVHGARRGEATATRRRCTGRPRWYGPRGIVRSRIGSRTLPQVHDNSILCLR